MLALAFVLQLGRQNERAMLSSSLFGAIEEGNLPLLFRLAEGGADVNARWPADSPGIFDKFMSRPEWQGRTALMLAADAGSVEMVAYLLRHGADINAQAEGGWTALMIASVAGEPEVVKVLLQNKARLDLADFQGYTALKWAQEGQRKLATRAARKSRYADVIRQLLQAGTKK